MRTHKHSDYEQDNDICNCRVKITKKNEPTKVLEGWMKKINNKQFKFEFIKNQYDYHVLTLWCDDWMIEYL